MDTNLVLPVGGQKLADFIFSLLGQRRTIAKNFKPKGLCATHGQLVSLLHGINQRVAQNESNLATVKFTIFFRGGRSVTLYDQSSFDTFNDLSHENTVGADLNLAYLVYFPGIETPEKQDIRITLFSERVRDSDYPREMPILRYQIETTNVTWGEDLSNHLSKALQHFVVKDRFLAIGRGLWGSQSSSSTLSALVTSGFIIVFMSFILAPSGQGSATWAEMVSKFANLSGMELVNAKLDFLISHSPFAPSEPNRTFASALRDIISSRRTWAFLSAAALVITSSWLLKRFAPFSFVACNRFTQTGLDDFTKTRENIKWAVVAAMLVGIMAGLLATRLDSFLFSNSVL
jgi:hypothetical protein